LEGEEKMNVLENHRLIWSRLMVGFCALSTVIIVGLLLVILGYIALRGLPGANLNFFTGLPVPVGMEGGGLAHAVAGSFILIGLACMIGIPWGIGTGIFLSEVGKGSWLGEGVRFTVDVLSGVPSIIIGIFVYSAIVVRLQSFSALAGGVALGVIMVPLVARNTYGILQLVPRELREAALALGLPLWKVILRVVLPTAARGIGIGVTLAAAGVAGETAPLFFTSLSNNYWSLSLLDPIASLPMEIFRYATAPFAAWQELAWTGALVLITIVVVVMLLARVLLPGYNFRR
jgi:phosphate transport system permease protein